MNCATTKTPTARNGLGTAFLTTMVHLSFGTIRFGLATKILAPISKDHYFGNMSVQWKFLDWLSLQGRLLQDFYTFRYQERTAIGGVNIASYRERVQNVTERNMDLILTANRQLGDDLSVVAFVGGNVRQLFTNRNEAATSGGLKVPNLYTISNSLGSVIAETVRSQKEVQSVFGSLSLGYAGMLYLDATVRTDWSSTLPKDNWAYTYPSVGLGFVFTELGGLNDNSVLSFGKIRGGYAVVGGDTDPYNLTDAYTASVNFEGSTPLYTVPNTLNNPELRPEFTASTEFGLETKFFQNRFGFDLTFYNDKSTDIIIPLAVDPATGYAFIFVNAGEITNKGTELAV